MRKKVIFKKIKSEEGKIKNIISDIENSKKNKLWSLFTQGAFASFSGALLSYVLSSYLSEFIDTKYVSFVYLVPNIISIILIYFFGHIIKKIGLFKASVINILLIFLSTATQIFFDNKIPVILSIMVYQISAALFWVFLDYYVEKYSNDGTTGNTKGIQWTIMNLTFIFGPLVAGITTVKYGFESIFLLSSLMMLPPLYFFTKDFSKIKHIPTEHIKIDIKKILNNKPIFKISLTSFILNFFYCWMSIYTPIYMNKDLNLSWDKIGIIIAFILIPFIIFQYPAGKIADKYLGEKEMLILGIIIMGLSTMALFFTNNIIFFTVFLFATRIGASLVEIMREVYLYKNLDSKDIDLISFYKTMSPLAWVVGSPIAGLLLNFTSIKDLYIILGFIVLLALTWIWNLKDTKINFKNKFIEM